MSITIEKLTDTLLKELNSYKVQLLDGIDEVYENISVTALKDIKSESENAGFDNKVYSKGWTKTVKKNRATGKIGVTIYNKKYYRLTHLLEKGHALRNGGRTRAFPHISKTQAKMDELIIQKLKERIAQ